MNKEIMDLIIRLVITLFTMLVTMYVIPWIKAKIGVHVMTDTIKNTLKIKNLMDSSYSYDGGWNASGTYSNDGRSGSYANSQRGYSNDGMSRYSGMHYVRGHYSRGKDFEKKIQEMMRNDRLSHEEKKTLEEAMEMLKDC